mgnify:CR=1 FL=1
MKKRPLKTERDFLSLEKGDILYCSCPTGRRVWLGVFLRYGEKNRLDYFVLNNGIDNNFFCSSRVRTFTEEVSSNYKHFKLN